MEKILEEISVGIQTGNRDLVSELAQKCIDQDMKASAVLNGMLSGMKIVGERFKNNEVYVPEVLMSARAMHGGLDVIQPLLESQGVEPVGTAVIGTVSGDLHDIGKNLVRMMLVGAGLNVIDLGVDVPKEKFIESAREHNANIICVSALLTTTMPAMQEVVEEFNKSDLKSTCKIMVGGAPITEEFCNEIGADKYSVDAATAATDAISLLS